MVFITKLFSAAAIVAASVGGASAALTITNPTADKWWGAWSIEFLVDTHLYTLCSCPIPELDLMDLPGYDCPKLHGSVR
jgi:hypothetical protein